MGAALKARHDSASLWKSGLWKSDDVWTVPVTVQTSDGVTLATTITSRISADDARQLAERWAREVMDLGIHIPSEHVDSVRVSPVQHEIGAGRAFARARPYK